MNRTKIEWCDYTINPVKGLCPMACPYCYARRMYKRFKWNPRLKYDASAWLGVGSLRKPSRIFVGSTMELFHPRTEKYLKYIFLEVNQSLKETPQYTFIFLTKQPQNLIKWSPFPENCWVGLTLTDFNGATHKLADFLLVKATLKFLSLEPLLGRFPAMAVNRDWFQWLIIGQQTPVSAKTEPKIEWLKEIVEAADRAGIPVFLKNNLEPLLGQNKDYKRFRGYDGEGNMLVSLRQEMPEILYCSTCRVRRR